MINLKDFEYVVINTDDERWFYNTGCQYPLVCPKGTKVKFVREFTNFYGKWYEVEYNGETRYIMPCYCDGNVIVEVETRTIFNAASTKDNVYYILTDRYGKKYKVINEEGDLELL